MSNSGNHIGTPIISIAYIVIPHKNMLEKILQPVNKAISV